MQATGDYILFMDADNSTRIFEIERVLPSFEEGFDVVIGSRRLKKCSWKYCYISAFVSSHSG